MADRTQIEWTDATWNPIRGCTRVSPGCGGPGPHGGCYAEAIAARFSGPGQAYESLAEIRDGKPRWTGRLSFGHNLDQPLRWRRPRRIFVNSMSDLFHEKVPDAWINQVFAIMALAPQHTFQVLTKRSARMRSYVAGALPFVWSEAIRFGEAHGATAAPFWGAAHAQDRSFWPLPNVWLGVSAEDQQRADERVPDLLATPAAVRFVSAEPLLGPIDFTRLPVEGDVYRDALRGWLYDEDPHDGSAHGVCGGYMRLDWVVVGGESGSNARPMHPDWAREIRDDCAAAGTAYLFKQWGAYGPGAVFDATPSARQAYRGEIQTLVIPGPREIKLAIPTRMDDRLGPALTLERYGKKAAGRLLDGVEHNGMPDVRP